MEDAAEAGEVKVNKAQLKKAISALKSHVAKKNEESNLLFNKNAETMTLLFSLAKVPEKRVLKPMLIPLPNPMFGEKSDICIFTKDPQKHYKALFAAHPVPGLKKVIGMDKLKKNYKTYDLKRTLCDNYDLFLCDKRVLEMMPGQLGKYFFQTKKKIPVPVLIEEKDPRKKVEEAIASTTLRIPEGPSCGVKIGRCEMEVDALLANAARVMKKTTEQFQEMGNAISSISLQATNAPALPIWYAAAPEKLLERRKAEKKKKEDIEEEEEEGSEDAESEEEDDADVTKLQKQLRKEEMPLLKSAGAALSSGKRKKGPAQASTSTEEPAAKKKKKIKPGK